MDVKDVTITIFNKNGKLVIPAKELAVERPVSADSLSTIGWPRSFEGGIINATCTYADPQAAWETIEEWRQQFVAAWIGKAKRYGLTEAQAHEWLDYCGFMNAVGIPTEPDDIFRLLEN